MPLFYALLGAIMAMPEPRWRRYVGIIFTSVSVFPIYLAIDSDFGFMRLHNVCLAIAAVLLLPGLRKYLEAKT
jgi:drug/metabolite transporter (DMT)-like permease